MGSINMIKQIFLLLFLSLMLVACTNKGTVDPLAQYRGYSASQLYHNGMSALAKGNYKTASKNFEALDANYPFGQYNQSGQYNIIYAYYMDGNYTEAGLAAERYIRLYPRAANVDYAYYMKGLSNFNQNRSFLAKVFRFDVAQRDMRAIKQSYQDFATLIKLYPNSRYAPDARQRMIFLRNMLAQHDLQVAQFYMLKRAYVAASNRAGEVVRKFPNSPVVQQALSIIVVANRKLQLDGPANDALRVLELNYPNSPELAKLRG